jgi:hypothetical protein
VYEIAFVAEKFTTPAQPLLNTVNTALFHSRFIASFMNHYNQHTTLAHRFITRRTARMLTAQIVLALVFVVCAVLDIWAQGDEVFKVIACKGKVTLQRTKKQVSVGTALNSADQVRLEGSSYLGLVHKNGKAIEWKSEGLVAVADLLKQVPPRQSGMEKLVGFVVQSVVGASEGKNELAGGAERGILMQRIHLLMPRTSKVIENDVTFTWTSGGNPQQSFIFTLNDASHNVRFKREVSDTTLSLNLQNLGLEKGQCYYWSVVAAQPTSAFITAPRIESYCLYQMNDSEAAAVKEQEQELQTQTGTQANILDKLVLAMFYEQHGMTYKAMSTYNDILKTNSDADVVKAAYTQFLRRMGVQAELQPYLR